MKDGKKNVYQGRESGHYHGGLEHVLKALLLNGLNSKLNIEWHHVLNDFEITSYLLVERNQASNQFLQMHNRDIFVMY